MRILHPMGKCYFCGKEFEAPVYRATVCPSCGKDLKICLNCKFYSPGSHYDCRETILEPVRDKERANFCDHFQPGSNYKEGSGRLEKESSAKKAFGNLFED